MARFSTGVLLLVFALSLPTIVSAQVTTSGRLTGVVTDSLGALVPKADVEAIQNETKTSYTTTASEEGSWSIPSVPNGTYTITVSAPNFKKTIIKNVKVDAGQVASANATLEPGGANEQIVITGGGEILQTETANVATTITGKQITELPFVTRDALQLVLNLPGVQTPGVPRTSSINGLPKGSVNLTLDGANIQDNFLRSSDGFFTQVQPKADAVQEVTLSSAVPGAESGGEGAVQVRFITKSGTSEFHGGAFWQYRSPRFNSNYYFNNIDGLPRDSLFLRQYGGHIGGPILIPKLLKNRERAFFFLNYEEFRLPQAYGSLSAVGNIFVLTPEARQGLFTYKDSGGTVRTINLLTLAASKGFPGTIDPTIGAGLDIINSAVRSQGALRSRIASANDFNRLDYQFQDPGTNIRRFPTARFDWNITKNQHMEFIHNYQFYYSTPDAVNGQNSVAPGQGIVIGTPGVTGSIYRDSFSYVMAHRWTINDRLANEIRATSGGNGTSVFTREFAPGLFSMWGGYAVQSGTFLGAQGNGTGAFYNRRTTSRRNTPTKGLTDNITFVQGDHTLNFGASFLRINSFTQAAGTQLVPQLLLGITSDDPMNVSVFTNTGSNPNFPGSNSTQLANAQSLYAILTGRVSAINRSASLDGDTKKYLFDSFTEFNHQNEWAFYGQDAWKVRPGLVLNYGLRWEFEPSPVNDNLVYTRTGYDGIFGVSGVGNLFSPGAFSGQPTQFRLLGEGEQGYRTRHHDFAPSFGFAYSPTFKSGFLKRLAGDAAQTVIRGGYSIAYTREGFNAYTAMFGTNEGGTVNLNVSPSLTPGIFPAGSVLFRNGNFPSLSPPADTSKYPFTPGFGSAGSSNDFDAQLKAGYTQSFSFGLQRELNKNTAVEVRFVRTRGTHLWRQFDLNEVNIFENGFLAQFKAAANNLAISRANNKGDNYGNQGLPGQVNVPLITVGLNSSTNSTMVTRLLQGQAGAAANTIAFNLSNMNRLINAGLVPFTTLPTSTGCVSGNTTSQTCKVSNFFVVNPQTAGGAFLMTQGTDTSFNALQVEVRRRLSNGLLFNGSYQYGKALANAFVSSSSVFSQPRTLRDPELDRNFSPWDVRHSFKLDYIYELPFGPGRQFFTSSNEVVKRLVGNWQVGGVVRVQSGPATLLTSGGRATVNQFDSGVVLHNMTLKDLEKMVQIRKDPSGIVYWLPKDVIDNTVAAFSSSTGTPLNPNAPYIGPPLTPGVFGERIVFHGPSTARFDFNVLKRVPLSEKVNLEGRVSFLNAFNRANFYLGDSDSTIRSVSAASTSFGQTRSAYRDITVSGTNDPGGRLIEWQFRINF
ncbi:MAG TPA: TonB-dependent receptor [Pyrinomonadaceae bacterium]|nr:TonB-dependent receptor [Pyrinomonadaceae bacterium]